MELTIRHFIGAAAALVLVFGIGIVSGRRICTAADFSVCGHRAGAMLVMGAILGTLVGGASTIGTAQLAYLYGFSAWWFTLGGGIACLLIALFLVRPMRETRLETISQLLAINFGSSAGVTATVFVSLGMFINIIPQMLSAIALLSSILAMGTVTAALLAAVLIISYVVFGGLWGSGCMGLVKIGLTCICLLVGGTAAYFLVGGAGGLALNFTPYPWFSLFGRGVNTDLASGFSLLVGVISSQIYFQAVFAGRNLSAARGGALLSALLAPAIGLGGILIGLFMRAHYPDINPAQALPLFVLNHLPAWFGGVVLATLLLASIGTGAGLTLGISTTLSRDIYLRFKPRTGDRQLLMLLRLCIVMIVLLALAFVLTTGGEVLLLQFSYLSLGLRGATVCFPLLAAIFLKDR
ncbi:MAG: sodium:solute symporter family protein, partial [Bacillota bacterium]